MSKYVSREAPIPGSSVSETHHGDWADRVRFEKHIRERWMNEYGRYYYQNPSACCATDDLRHPLDTQQPPMRQIDNYLGPGTVPRSQPMAYLRACMEKKDQYDGSVWNVDKMGTRTLKCTKCWDIYNVCSNEASMDKNDCANHSAGSTFIPSDTCVHVDRSSQDQNICSRLEYSGLPWPLHPRSVALSTNISAIPRVFCRTSSDCERMLKQNDRSSLREVQKISGPLDSAALQCIQCPLPPRSTALHNDIMGTPVCCGSSDCARILKRNDRSSLHEVQKISGPLDTSALRCLPWPLPLGSTTLQADILGTPVCCGSSSGERGHLANYLRKHSTSEALVPEKKDNVTTLPGRSRMPCDSSVKNYSGVVPRGYQQPFGKPFKGTS